MRISVITFAWFIALVSFSQADPPKNYYAAAANKTGAELKSALHDIIDDHRVVRYSSKNPDTADALARLDADPEQPNSVVLIYSRRSEPVSNFGTSSGWNREHLWPNSYGIDKRGPAYSDLHNLRPADASVNSARSNKIYDTSDVNDERYQRPGHREAGLTSEDSDSWEPPTEVRGEVARAAFYMDVRYSGDRANENDLELTDDLSAIDSDGAFFGNLSTLLEWHLADPVDAAERKRNDLVYSAYQRNRNPFVDHPEWVMAIYAPPKSQSRLSNPKARDGMIATPGSPPVLVQSFHFDIELARPGKFVVLKSTDLVHWVEAKQSVPGRLHVGFPRDEPSCFFRVQQRPDGD